MTIKLVKTCGACPEQYDAFNGDTQVGYLRLRNGQFTVEVPDVRGETIYEALPEGDGKFEDHERDYYLRFAVDAIQRHLKNEPSQSMPPPLDVEYEIG